VNKKIRLNLIDGKNEFKMLYGELSILLCKREKKENLRRNDLERFEKIGTKFPFAGSENLIHG